MPANGLRPEAPTPEVIEDAAVRTATEDGPPFCLGYMIRLSAWMVEFRPLDVPEVVYDMPSPEAIAKGIASVFRDVSGDRVERVSMLRDFIGHARGRYLGTYLNGECFARSDEWGMGMWSWDPDSGEKKPGEKLLELPEDARIMARMVVALDTRGIRYSAMHADGKMPFSANSSGKHRFAGELFTILDTVHRGACFALAASARATL